MEILEEAKVCKTNLTENQNEKADKPPHDVLVAQLPPLNSLLSLANRP